MEGGPYSQSPSGSEVKDAKTCESIGLSIGGTLRDGALKDVTLKHLPCGRWMDTNNPNYMDNAMHSNDSAECKADSRTSPVCSYFANEHYYSTSVVI